MAAHQVSFEELGTPLFDVTFVVVDLETTGLSPASDRITEIGAVKVRRGEVLGELATLVHPGRAIPPAITAVTGITDAMVRRFPPIEAVLPAFLEFSRGTVLVAHNAAFDTGFLDAALARLGYPPLALPVVDTARLGRRLLRDEVRDARLSTLARHLRARTVPEHRALPDARATVDVLHGLVERAGALGATTLEDLQDLARSTSDRSFRKVSLVRDAPHDRGVYRFLDERGEVLYVGKSADLRTRLRRYFGQDRRRRVADLVRETAEVRWVLTPTELEAEVREVRAIQAARPRYNRRSKHPERGAYVKLTDEPFPRLSIVTGVRGDGATYLGPLSSRRAAEQVVEALHDVVPLRRCTGRLRLRQDHPACVLKDLGRCGAPCDGTQSREHYGQVAEQARAALANDPGPVLARLRLRMEQLADGGRFERAAGARARLHAFGRAVADRRRLLRLASVPRLAAARPTDDGWEVVVAAHGRLLRTARVADLAAAEAVSSAPDHVDHAAPAIAPGDGLLPRPEHAEELRLLDAWLLRPGVRVVSAVGTLASPVRGGAELAALVDEQRRVAAAVRRDHQVLTGAKVARRTA